MSGEREIGALRVRVLPDFAGFRGAAAAEGHAAGNLMGSGLAGAVREHWKGLVGGLAVAELGKQVVDFAKDSVNAFKTSATGALQLQRAVGGTVEDTSRLRFALGEMGVQGDTANTLIGKLSKTLVTQSETSKGSAKLFDQLGFSVKDATGHLLPMSELLPKIADRFKELPAGPEKTALAMQLFGRSGQTMLRFLNQGSEGIKELEKESDKYGTTISTKGVQDLLKYDKAHRALSAAQEGLKISIGEKLMPILATFETWLAAKGIPALEKFGSWIKANVIPVIQDFARIVQHDVLPPLQAMFEFFQKHPAVLHAVETAAKTMIAVWAAWKIAGLVSKLWEMAAAIGAVGAASATAGAEGAAGAAAGAEGAAAGAGRASRLSAAKFIVPVAVFYAVSSATGLDKVLGDFIHGDIGKAVQDSPKWTKEISGALGKALKLTHLPGLDGSLFSGDLVGTAVGKWALAPGFAESLKAVQADKKVITDFSATLKVASNLLDTNSKTLVGNSTAAVTNRDAIALLAKKAKEGADAQLRLTGKQSDYTAALNLGVGAIEGTAEAMGFNKRQVDTLLTALGLLPPEKAVPVTTPGADTAVVNLGRIKEALDAIPLQKQVDISVLLTGTAPDALIAQAATGGGHGLGGGGLASGGIGRGWTWVGEKGPELVNFGSPSRVLNHQDSVAATSGNGGPLLNIEHWHGDQTDAAGLASMLNAQQRAYAASKGI